ncbi:MAG: hypothetical protein IJU60_00365 [Acholeplasmatales bacterium]|nr:hypothetical protein [Acholeplasmatales bacterium]
MKKLLDTLAGMSELLFIILFAVAGSFIAITDFGSAGGVNNAQIVMSLLVSAVIALAAFGLAITAIIMKKKELAKIMIALLSSYILVRAVVEFSNTILTFAYTENGFSITILVFELISALTLIVALVTFVIPFFKQNSNELRDLSSILLFAYVCVNVLLFVLGFVNIFVNNLGWTAFFTQTVYYLVYPSIILVAYLHLFYNKMPEAKEEVDQIEQ